MNKAAVILILYFLISFITGIEDVWKIDSRIYFCGQQVCNGLLLFLILPKPKGINRIITISLLILTGFEFIDELLKLNDRFRIYDYVVTGMILLWTIYRAAKCNKKKQNL